MPPLPRTIALLVVFTFALSAHAAIPDGERQVLLALYDATGGDNWTNHTGWKGAAGTECTWFGISCNGDHVFRINLDSNNLTGTLPALSLPSLRTISVAANHLAGPFPDFASNTNLQDFTLSSNALTGEIPRSILNLTNLGFVTIDDNGFTASDAEVRAFVDHLQPGWETSQTVTPSGVVTRADNRSTITVSFNPNPFLAYAHYEVVASTGTVVAVPYIGSSATFGNLDASQSYGFKVRAITDANPENSNRLVSAYSATIQATPGPEARTFDIGVPTTRPFWVDPVNGSDTNDGATKLTAFKTMDAAWNAAYNASIGSGVELVLRPGDYPAGTSDSSYGGLGSYERPTIVRAEIPGTAHLHSTLFVGGSNTYIIGIAIDGVAGNAILVGGGDFVLLRDVRITGTQGIIAHGRAHMFLENVRIENPTTDAVVIDTALYGHIVGSRISGGASSCVSLTEGVAYFTIDGNDLTCKTALAIGGLAHLDRMSSPWIHYDTYGVKVINNVIHDFDDTAFAFSGAYDLLFAHNTVVTSSAAPFILARQGNRICGDVAGCQARHDAGGWGPGMQSISAAVPNRNVAIFDNIFSRSSSSAVFLNVASPVATQPPGSIVPAPSLSDDNLQIRGNIISSPSLTLIAGGGCDNSNPTCNTAQLMSDNRINAGQAPQFVDPTNGNYHPVAFGNLFGLPAVTIPNFTWADAPTPPPVPTGELVNTVVRDADNVPRAVYVPGAFSLSAAPTKHRAVAR